MSMPKYMITLTIPIPTSTNRLQRSARGGGRYNSKEYEAWKAAAGAEILAQRPQLPIRSLPAGRPYNIVLRLPESVRGDRDNRLKAALDLLAAMGITPDDSLNHSGGYGPSQKLPSWRAEVTVWTVDHPDLDVMFDWGFL